MEYQITFFSGITLSLSPPVNHLWMERF